MISLLNNRHAKSWWQRGEQQAGNNAHIKCNSFLTLQYYRHLERNCITQLSVMTTNSEQCSNVIDRRNNQKQHTKGSRQKEAW